MLVIQSLRGKNNGRDQVDEITTRFTEETIAKIQSQDQDTYKKVVINEMQNGILEGEFDPEQIWPTCFANEIKRELKQSHNNLKSVGEYLRTLYSLKVGDTISRMITNYNGENQFYHKIKRLLQSDFRGESAMAAIQGIENGRHVIISRVLETDVDWLFSKLAIGLYMAEFYKKRNHHIKVNAHLLGFFQKSTYR